MAAALLRLLPRRRAATLTPLIPASMSSYSKPPHPLRAVTAAGGLPDLRRAQLCASPAPSLHRLYASEGCPRPAPRQRVRAHHQATCRLHKASSATTTVHPGRRHMQPSLLLVNVLRRLRKPTDPRAIRYLKVLGLALFLLMFSHWIQTWRLLGGSSEHCAIMMWFLDKVRNDLREQFEMMNEALETCEKAIQLLEDNRLDGKAFVMLHQGMDDFSKARAIYHKVAGDSVEVIRSWAELMTLSLRELRMLLKSIEVFSKEMDDHNNMTSLRMNKLLAAMVKLRKGAKGSFPGQLGSHGLEDV